MEKKPSVNKTVAQIQNKALTFGSRCILALRLLLGALSIPLIIGVTIGFSKSLTLLERDLLRFFIAGIVAYLILHHFIYKPVAVYKFGQKVLQFLFGFFAPLVKIASYLLPIYALLIIALFFILTRAFNTVLDPGIFLFLIAFSFSFHLILTADALRDKEAGLGRANYFFGFSLIYLLNIVMLAAGLHFIFSKFSFLGFLSQSGRESWQIYQRVFGQLFL